MNPRVMRPDGTRRLVTHEVRNMGAAAAARMPARPDPQKRRREIDCGKLMATGDDVRELGLSA
jgi:hypothetical protein